MIVLPSSSAGERAEDAPRGWLATRVLGIAGLFALLALPVIRIGEPTSEAYGALRAVTSVPSATRTGGPLDFAIIGNSRPHVGLSPRLVSEGLERGGLAAKRGWNFSVNGTDALHHASFGIHGLLALPKPPRVVVWTVDPLMFDASRKSNRLEQLVASDVPMLARSGAPLEVVLDVATMQAFPPYRHRPLVLAKIEDKTESIGLRLQKVQRFAGLVPVEHPKPRRYLDPEEGYEPFLVVADWAFRFYERHAVHYAAEYQALVVSEWHARFAERFLAAAQDAQVVVVLLEMPISPYYREHFASGAKHQEWRARMRRLAEARGALFISDADRYSNDTDFGDPGHMPLSTAEDYSRYLGEALARDPRVTAALQARPHEDP